jgi:hypothetical protein
MNINDTNGLFGESLQSIYGEGGGGGGCFPAGVKINTPTGYKSIETLIVGDEVYAFDISSLEPDELNMPGEVCIKQVTATYIHTFGEVGYTSPLLIITHEKGILNVTGNHYILTPSKQSVNADKGFALASELAVGDVLYTEYGEKTTILSIDAGVEYDYVYNLEVADVHAYVADKIRVHNGGGGGKSSPRAAVQAPNTVRTNQIARVLNLVSEGETFGPWNTSHPAQSIFFDNTPLQNSDLSYNYTNITVDTRVGQPSQSVITGFSAVEAESIINIAVTTVSPVTETVASGINAVRVTLEFNAGLQQIDASTGDASGTSVNFTLYTRVTAGTWAAIVSPTITEMSGGPFQVAYRLQNPGTGGWEFKVVRNTADSSSNYLINALKLKSFTNIQEVALPYNDRALYALTVGADSTNNQIPTMAADWGGILCSVPSNYNASTKVYTGSWGGAFASTKVWTNNPVWLLLELIKNSRYGLGSYIDTSQIDVFSFYNAAVYCDALVDDGKGTGTFENRFTFDAQLMVRDDAWKTLQAIASTFRAMLYIHNGYIRLSQDRPTTYTRILGNSQVLNGMFTYSASDGRTRFTACNATYSDITDNCLPKTITETASSANITRYGYTTSEIVSYGATTEGQARRDARWVVDTSINNTEFVECQVGPQYADFEPGEVFNVMDVDYAQVTQEGRLISASGTTLVLDEPVTITTGTWTIDCISSDGSSIETRTITTGAGTTATISISASISGGAGTAFVISGAISPRPFRCISMVEIQPLIYTIRGVQYDPTKYARIETGVILPSPVYWAQPKLISINSPTNLIVTPQTSTDPNSIVKRYLMLSWTAPADQSATSYRVSWKKDNGITMTQTCVIPSTRIDATLGGVYTFYINAINAVGVTSPTLNSSYTLDMSPGTGSGIGVPTGLTFTGTSSLHTSWTPPANTVGFILQDYKVELVVPGGALFKTFYTLNPFFDYSYDDNVRDGGPRNSIKVNVYARDTYNKTGSAVTGTWSALSGASISALQVRGGGTIFSTLDLDVVWTCLNGASTDFTTDPTFGWYEVDIYNGATKVRGEQVYQPTYQYTFQNNVKDNGQGTPLNSIIIKITAYSNLGVPSATATNTFTPAAPPTVTALYVKGTTGTTFNQSDLELVWTCVDGAGADFTKSNMFSNYRVRAYNGATLKRTDSSLVATYVYDYFKNTTDNTTAFRTPGIEVAAVNVYNVVGTVDNSTFSNPTPGAPNITTTVGYDYLFINAVRQSADVDVVGYEYHISTTSGFTPSGSVAGTGTCFYTGPNSSISYPVAVAGTTYYVKVACYDGFGNTGLSYSTQTSGATALPVTFNDYVFPGFTFTPNTPSTNSISWSAGTAQKTGGTGSPATYSVSAGNAAWTSGSLYVYWDETTAPTTLHTTTSITTATGTQKRILAVYTGGTSISPANGKIIIDGTTQIFPGTISAPSLVTGSAVITNAAQMGSATIATAAIQNLAVTNAQINDLTVNSIKLANGCISDTRFFVSNASVTLASSSGVGSTTISPYIVASLVVTAPNPTGLTGPFPTFISANLSTNTRVNGAVAVSSFSNGGINNGTVTLTSTLNVVGTPNWQLVIIRNSDSAVIGSTAIVPNGSGAVVGNSTASAFNNGGVNSGTVNISNVVNVNGGGGLNQLFLSANLSPGVAYTIQIIASGTLVISTNSSSTPCSITADTREIYYQCLLR